MYRFHYRGVEVTCETADEVRALLPLEAVSANYEPDSAVKRAELHQPATELTAAQLPWAAARLYAQHANISISKARAALKVNRRLYNKWMKIAQTQE